jgi:2-oxoglutarate dehydrogenase complex dehydrogenase (E1) component-like enzyme
MTDQASEEKVIPLNHIDSKQGRLSVADSPLSEFAVTGFGKFHLAHP